MAERTDLSQGSITSSCASGVLTPARLAIGVGVP